MGSIQKIIRKTKTSYRARYFVSDENGKRIQKGKSFDRYKDARDFLYKTEHQLRESTYIEPSKTLIKNFLNDWLTLVSNDLAPNTVRGYKKNIEHASKCIGHIEVQSLTPAHIRKMYSYLGSNESKPTLSGTSLLYIHRTLHRAFSMAEENRIINQNPFRLVDAPKKSKYNYEFYDSEEVKKLIECIQDSKYYIPIILAVTRGMRRNEILGLRWQDVDFNKRKIYIRHSIYWENGKWSLGNTKSNDSSRTIPLSDKLIHDLKEQKRNQKKYMELFWSDYYKSDFICTHNDGTLIKPRGLSKAFADLLKKHNLKHIRFHDLRHTAASLMLQEGIAMKVISDILGHSSISITADLYSHVLDDMKKEAANIMDKFI